jgi:hypothetical protein
VGNVRAGKRPTLPCFNNRPRQGTLPAGQMRPSCCGRGHSTMSTWIQRLWTGGGYGRTPSREPHLPVLPPTTSLAQLKRLQCEIPSYTTYSSCKYLARRDNQTFEIVFSHPGSIRLLMSLADVGGDIISPYHGGPVQALAQGI